MKKILLLVSLTIGATSSFAAIQCDIYEGLKFRNEEQPYDSCKLDYNIDIQGVPTTVQSCSLVEQESGIFYEIEAGKTIGGKELLTVKRGNSEGYLPGTRYVYFENIENHKTNRESVYHKGTTRLECRKLF